MKNKAVRKIGAALLYIAFVVGLTGLMFYLIFGVFSSRSPRDAAIDRQGYIYVADTTTNQVRKFTAEGEQKLVYGQAKAPFTFGDYLERLAVDGRGNVFTVANFSRVKKYDANGNFLFEWEAADHIADLAADSAGNVYLKYFNKDVFQKLDANAKLVKEWTTPHRLANKELSSIFIDEQDNIYAADSVRATVYKFDAAGNQLAVITGIADLGRRYTIDQNGYIYTVSFMESKIQKWDWNGKLVKTWGGHGNGPGQFDYKYKYDSLDGLVADSRGYIFAVYKNNNQAIVQQYDTDGRFIRRWTDGYPFGTVYLIQFLLVIFLVPFAVYVSRRLGFFRPSRFLTPAPLPENVIAAENQVAHLRNAAAQYHNFRVVKM